MKKGQIANVWMLEEPGGSFVNSEASHRSLQSKEVLVRIAAGGVNPLDTKIRAGKAGLTKPSTLLSDRCGA